MMKSFKKMIAFIMAGIMTLCVFSACTNNDETVHTGGSYTYWAALDNNVGQTLKSFNELMMYQEMEKRTGTKVEFLHPSAGSTGGEAFQVLLASGDYPDMIEYRWNEYPGGGDQAINDGVIIALNDFMEEYAPNYYDIMEGEKAKENAYMYKASTISNAGNYYGFKNINVGRYRGFNGLFVRRDLLEKWGLDVPTTIDEWEIVLKTAKENGIKYPLTGTSGFLNLFSTAWGVFGTDFHIENGKVKFGPFQNQYKDYVTTMTDWMEKGYIDIDYVTNDTTIVNGYITNGTSIAANSFVSNIAKLLSAMETKDAEFDLVACPFPVMKKGEVPKFQAYQAPSSEPTIAVSTACGIDNEERYKEAIKWCDYLFSDEGMVLKCFGIEGETFTIQTDENGEKHYVYTDRILKDHEEYGAHSIGAALYHHFLPANHPGYNQHPDYFKGYYPYQQQKDALEIWNKYVEYAAQYVFPTVTYSSEEASQKASIEATGLLNLQAGISNIILGKQPIDTFDDVIKAAKDAGYDELIKINQAAYDRYIKAVNH